MGEISLEIVTGKLNRVGYDAFIQALRHAKGAGNRNVELAHWLAHILRHDRSDVSLTADKYKLDRVKLATDIDRAVDGFKRNVTEMPGISNAIIDALDRGWHYATLAFGETQIRTGHVLVAALKTPDLLRSLTSISAELGKIPIDQLTSDAHAVWRHSDEDNLRTWTARVCGARAPRAPPRRRPVPVPRGRRRSTVSHRI